MTRLRFVLALLWAAILPATQTVEHPFRGVTHITRTETSPRPMRMHIVKIDLTAPGIAFAVTPPGGSLETKRQTTLDFLRKQHAQIAINAHFFLPFPSTNPEASLVGFAASRGLVYSAFETPSQSYAIVKDAPAIHIDRANHAIIAHRDPDDPRGTRLLEKVEIWNAIAGSAQIITNGVKTIPEYGAQLVPGGPRGGYSNAHSWYDRVAARTVIGLSEDNRTLFLFTVDASGGSLGMRVGEIADLLIKDYGVYNALNLDGGGSTTLAMENPKTHAAGLVNVSSDKRRGRSVGSNLAVFAEAPAPVTYTSRH